MNEILITIILTAATTVIVFGSLCAILFMYVLLRDFIEREFS